MCLRLFLYLSRGRKGEYFPETGDERGSRRNWLNHWPVAHVCMRLARFFGMDGREEFFSGGVCDAGADDPLTFRAVGRLHTGFCLLVSPVQVLLLLFAPTEPPVFRGSLMLL